MFARGATRTTARHVDCERRRSYGTRRRESDRTRCGSRGYCRTVFARGSRRVNINDFYEGYKQKDLAADEIIVRVHVPLQAPDELLKLYKVSRRNDLDIATFGAAVRMRTVGGAISRAFIAYSGVAATRKPTTSLRASGGHKSRAAERQD